VSASSLNCLVTGGAGFIGSHVAEHLVRVGHRVRVVDNLSTGDRANLVALGGGAEFVEGDLTDPALCARVVRGVELVWHLAALPSVPRSMQDPRGCHEHNVNATMNLLLAAREAGVRRLVYSSSSSVYGDTAVLPKVETVEPLPRSPYAAAKLAGEQSVLAFARAGMIEGVALRYFNVFGPRQSPTSAYAAVIPAWLAASAQGVPAKVYGDGLQTRDFTYVDNVVAANLAAATLPPERVSGWVVNIGAGTQTTLRDLARLIGEVTGRALVTEMAPPRAGDVKHSLASLERAREVLGFELLVPLREGLERTWNWLRNARS
jgi:UDP-glucose 4-epimerase